MRSSYLGLKILIALLLSIPWIGRAELLDLSVTGVRTKPFPRDFQFGVQSCPNANPPSIANPNQLDRLNGIFQEVGKFELLPTEFLQEMAIVMGECHDGDKVDKDREKTRLFLEREIGKYFNKLDPLVQDMFNPDGKPSDQSYDKIKNFEQRDAAYVKARQKDAFQNFLNVAFWARSLLGEIAYKQDCGAKGGSVTPHLRAAGRVFMNRAELLAHKGSCGVTEWNHMVKKRGTKEYEDKAYKPKITSKRDIVMSAGEFNVWDPNDPSRHKALCPAQKVGQPQPIPEKEFLRNVEREKQRARETGEKQRPVYRYTKLNQARVQNWQDSVATAYLAVMHPEEFKSATSAMDPCQLFYSSGQNGWNNMAKNKVVPIDGNRIRINGTPINDPSCIQIWRPLSPEEVKLREKNKEQK